MQSTLLVIAEYLVGIGVAYLIVAFISTKQFNHPLPPFKAAPSAPPLPPTSGTVTSIATKPDGSPPAQP